MRGTGSSILVVDDSATMRAIVHDMLTRLGFRDIDEAEDGKSALARIQARSYALIISDWNMEPMNGIELLREVRRMRTREMARFIFATSESTWGRQTTAKLDGADAFIVKPFSIDALRVKIAAILG